MDPDQTAPIGAVCSGSTLFASKLNLSVVLGNYLQQTTSADNIFRCIFSGESIKNRSDCPIPFFLRADVPIVKLIMPTTEFVGEYWFWC